LYALVSGGTISITACLGERTFRRAGRNMVDWDCGPVNYTHEISRAARPQESRRMHSRREQFASEPSVGIYNERAFDGRLPTAICHFSAPHPQGGEE
jgi:hypothetical protein